MGEVRCGDDAAGTERVDDGRIRPMMAPATNVVHTPETLAAMKAAAQELHGLHIHLQSGYGRAPQPDTQALQRLWGLDEVPWLDSLGIFDGTVRVFGARESTHNKINADLGVPDDPGTKALFEFVDEALKK